MEISFLYPNIPRYSITNHCNENLNVASYQHTNCLKTGKSNNPI